jgi:subtilisin family serine protease
VIFDVDQLKGTPGRKLKKEPKDDPMDIYGHGTHVAGIIAGKTEQLGHAPVFLALYGTDIKTSWTGVAPEATLLGYKVFGSGVRP